MRWQKSSLRRSTKTRFSAFQQSRIAGKPFESLVRNRWARLDGGGNPVLTTYSYDPNSAQMSGITYSDGTQAVGFTYDRGGRQSTITDAAGAHTLTHNAAGQLQADQITGGLQDGITVAVGYDSFL